MVVSTRRIVIGIAVLMLSVGFSALVSAQTTPDDPNLQAVLQAFATARSEGYHYVWTSLSTISYTAADNSTDYQYVEIDQEGDVNTDGESHRMVKLAYAPTMNTLKNSFRPLYFELLWYDGEIYVYIKPTDWWSKMMFDVKGGWWRYEDFKAHLVEPELNFISQIIAAGEPAALSSATMFLSVSNMGTDYVANQAMREYAVQQNFLPTVLQSAPGTGSEHLVNLLKYAPVLLSSQPNLSQQFQISADDSRLYHSGIDLQWSLPFLSTGFAAVTPYDVHYHTVGDITFTYPDQPIVITPPDSSLLNH